MKTKLSLKIISFVLVLATLMTVLPLSIFAEEIKNEDNATQELYLKDVKLVQAKTKEEAMSKLTLSGYAFLDENLNEGTGADGIWMGYQTTTDPNQAIYDMKLMNTKGGFTRSSMETALASQESALAEMAQDLNYLIEEFIEAYKDGSVAAQKAYKALNFFRVVNGETELVEENGLGYQIVGDNVTLEMLTEIILFCDPVIVDTIIKILTMGIQIKDENWMSRLSDIGPYDEETEYMDDEVELSRRAGQLLSVLQLYSEVYNVMVKSGLMPDELDENFNPVYKNDGTETNLTASEADLQKLEEGRYKFYKLATDELAKYPYGKGGKTLKDFFASLATEDDESVLYPLVSALTSGEFAALSYGCFLELATGANATEEDFSSYDEVFAEITEEASSVYLYMGVNQALFEDEAIVGFTETAQRHMAATGDLEFFESENADEAAWETGTRIVTGIGVACMAIIGLTKISVGVTALVAAATGTQTAAMAATIKYGTMIGGLKGLLVAVAIVAVSLLITYIVAISQGDGVDWENDPMLQYVFDVKEATFMQASDDGIATDFMKRPVFVFYEAVTDLDGELVDLNARSDDSSRWIQLFVSRDKQGVDAKPIKCDTETGMLRVQKGNGEAPDGYTPVTHFGEVIAYNLNQWDDEDAVNGIYLFYQQDMEIAVDDDVTLYISDVQLQTGESDAHCIKLLQDAGYTPINVNLSPDLTDGDFMFEDKIYTYLGYKTSTSKASAIRDIRLVYGPAQGSIQYGAATYAACGSNGYVTLYATKYEISGTPLLAGGLICVDKQSKAPLGYEPVCLMSGGPAVPVNVNNDGEIREDNGFMYLYFLPETTFTSGKQYLGGLAVFGGNVGQYDGYYDQIRLPTVTKDLWGGYVPVAGNTERYVSMLAYYPTYNPYRAVYGIKAADIADAPQTLILEGTPYYAWNTINWGYQWHKDSVDKDIGDKDISRDLTLMIQTTGVEAYSDGAFYLTGNPDGKNKYDAKKGKMTKTQPIEISDVLFFDTYSNYNITVPEAFYPVINAFTNVLDEPMRYEARYATFAIYTKTKNEERPYVSNITAVDTLTLYRAYGGSEKGVTLDQITDSMRYSYLVSQGATEIRSFTPGMGMYNIASFFGVLAYQNHTQFGITRSSKGAQALRDVFFYFNGFSTDAPPKELYRGSVKYTLLCEIPHNLLGSADVPKASAYLYGTTNSKAGDRIVDLQISTYPYMEGYETVRTMDGRSLWSKIRDYGMSQANLHPMDGGNNFFEAFTEFFDNDDRDSQVELYYLHIKRENDDKVQKPYVEKLYLTSFERNSKVAIDSLFDQGAETFVQVDLNANAGGDFIYLGYSYTSNPEKAIKEIRAYHNKSHPATMTDDDGRVFELVKDIDLNKGAGGDYIYLYTSKGLLKKKDKPIISISAGYKVITQEKWENWIGGTRVKMTTHCTKQWDSSKNSDLNKGAGGEYVYLMYTTVNMIPNGLPIPKQPNYGKDKTYSRDPFEDQTPDGKYVGGVYVMDKETIRLEKIENGILSASSKCQDITDQEVFDRLKAMGATTIIQTPIMVNSGGYFDDNANKVFIGYSRTDVKSDAITNLAIKAEITSIAEPATKIDVDNNKYTLVAEAADEVTELPKAINLIGISGGRDVLLPRLYLYYSTSSGSDPISSISIDNLPLLNNYNTVRSSNLIDPFADIYQQACAMRDLVDKDDMLSYYDNYSAELADWMDEIAGIFDPEDADINPFYIHVQRYTENPKPYIGEVFIAKGDSKHEALSNLIAFSPDGFIDVDLNEDAGGDYVYMAYKRTGKSRDALTDIVVYEGEKFEPTRRIKVNGETVKYTLVTDIDLNSGAGGKTLYLYTTDSNDIGNPIRELNVITNVDSYLKCGVERVTVKRVEGTAFTDEYIDLNKSAGGDYLYLVMTRETTEGHRSNGLVTEQIITEATCTEDGCRIEVSACADCGVKMETVAEVLEAHGNHTDDAEDGDHKCDVCGKRNVTDHTFCGYVEKDPEDSTKSIFIQRCSDCEEPNGVQYPITESKTYKWDTGAASLLGDGSVIVLCAFAGVAILAAIIIFMKKKKATNIKEGDREE